MKIVKYISIFLLGIQLIGCTKIEPIAGEYPANDDFYKPSNMCVELSKDTIAKKIEGYYLNVEGGSHGDLTVGMDTVSINLPGLFNSKTPSRRVFGYYIPRTLSNNFRIMFELHGNFDDTFYGAYSSSTSTGPWQSSADKYNTVVIQPIGSQPDGTGYGFYPDCGDQYLIDILVELFRTQIKKQKNFDLDMNSIYSTGTSSGGIFSFQLAYLRSNLFTVIVPRFGSVQYNYALGNLAQKRVPMRVITGMLDTDHAPYYAVIKNTTEWATRGYKILTPPVKDSLTGEWFDMGKPPVATTTKIWTTVYNDNAGGYVEIQLYEKAMHSQLFALSAFPDIMKFMVDHTPKQ